uniref:Uncharacterized protein n=1 Tax=Peronospora matthiolae TaxID=2874970 RepID=A0AAV1VCF8_9STRA
MSVARSMVAALRLPGLDRGWLLRLCFTLTWLDGTSNGTRRTWSKHVEEGKHAQVRLDVGT